MAEAHKELVRALVNRGGDAHVAAVTFQPWWSATFWGVRHQIVLTADAAAIARIADGLDEHEFALSGHLVADIAVTDRGEGQIAIEALTIEEV